MLMKPHLLAKARQKWPGVQCKAGQTVSQLEQQKQHHIWTAACVAVANILTLPENDEVMVVGTVYKDMKLKPSILDEYVKVCGRHKTASVIGISLQTFATTPQLGVKSQAATIVCLLEFSACILLQDRGASQLVGRTKFVGADDSIILEDESARMKLRGDSLPVGQLVTGVVMAVKGVAAPGGDFQVNVRWCALHTISVNLASQHICASSTNSFLKSSLYLLHACLSASDSHLVGSVQCNECLFALVLD